MESLAKTDRTTVVGRMSPQKCPYPNSWKLNALHAKRGFAGIIKVRGLIGIILDYLDSSHLTGESLKADYLLWLKADKMLQKGKSERCKA